MPQRSVDIQDLLVWAFGAEAVETSSLAHPDAITVFWAVRALPASHIELVAGHARHGSMPQWSFGEHKVVPLAAVRRARADYSDWVRALGVLQRTLEGSLGHYRVTGPGLAEEPWRMSA